MKKQATSLVTSLITVAIVTTLVLPGRKTPEALRNFFGALSGAVTSVITMPNMVVPTGATSPTGSGGSMVPVPVAESGGGGGGGFGAR